MGEYAKLVHPNIPRISPTANINQTIALLAFSDIASPSSLSEYGSQMLAEIGFSVNTLNRVEPETEEVDKNQSAT